MSKRKRIGIVRCDTHGFYFGAIMDGMEPLKLQKYDYVCHHYLTDIYNPERFTAPKVPGFEITKIYDNNPEKAANMADAFGNRPFVAEKLEDMIDGIDAVFIADCDGNGSDHLELATPFLENGIPAFIDKPFASNLNDARKIIELAQTNNTPILNSSILSQVPAAEKFKSRFDEITTYPSWPIPKGEPVTQIGLGVVKGVGGAFSQDLAGKAVTGGLEERMAYIIHGVALALNLFGRGVEWVEAMGSLPLEYVHLHLKNGIEIMIMNTSVEIFPETCSFFASAYSKHGAVHSPPIGDPEFIYGAERIVKLLKQMLETGKAPIRYDDILEHIAVIEAGQKAQKEGKRVFLKDILK